MRIICYVGFCSVWFSLLLSVCVCVYCLFAFSFCALKSPSFVCSTVRCVYARSQKQWQIASTTFFRFYVKTQMQTFTCTKIEMNARAYIIKLKWWLNGRTLYHTYPFYNHDFVLSLLYGHNNISQRQKPSH